LRSPQLTFRNRKTESHAEQRPHRVAGAILTADDIAVIRERRCGWEQASPSLLAAVFGVSVQKITAVCRERN
jgi:hypothetical protein